MTGTEAPASGRLAPGFVIDDRYRIGELIGQGGSGLIYGAEDLHEKQGVAIKTLNADLLSHPSAVARYHREARAAASIGHPSICSVLDAGQLRDSRPYLVMELLSGQTLADRLKDHGALPFPQVLSVLTQTLSALAAAHDKKILHRDIKPDNVFLTDRIRGVLAVKLLDFGIAKSLDENAEVSLTRTGMVVGTPYCMAPEQARGEPLDHRVDLYACGILLYEMLTGRRPFQATDYRALMMQVLTVDPPDPRHLRPAIPSGFISLMHKATAKDRRDRYEDARAFLAAVWDLQGHLAQGLDADVPAPSQPMPPEQTADSFVEATEVMTDAPWLRDTGSNNAPSSPPKSEPPSWDDEPTRVKPPPFAVSPDSASGPKPPPASPDKGPGKRSGRLPLDRDTGLDPTKAPRRVPRPKRKG